VRTEQVARVPGALGLAVRAGDEALYVVSQAGAVWAVRDGEVDPEPALDLRGRVTAGGEQGLLGLVFSPDGHYGYVNYTDLDGDTNVVEYKWTSGTADPATKRRILFVDQPFANHNGGDLAFGPDGYLYIGLGDGGSDYSRGDPQGDPDRNGQNLGVLLGKMLRIQARMADGSLPPNGDSYAIPDDNPFVGDSEARPEIWAYGLRNPWRFSFDRETGDLWIADVGAGDREEVDMQPASSNGGENYGWNAVEGAFEWRRPPPDAVPPVYDYTHAGTCAVVGGFVYRGTAIPELAGRYVFGDYCGSQIEAIDPGLDAPEAGVVSDDAVSNLVAFGEDADGELYALSLDGGVFRLVAA